MYTKNFLRLKDEYPDGTPRPQTAEWYTAVASRDVSDIVAVIDKIATEREASPVDVAYEFLRSLAKEIGRRLETEQGYLGCEFDKTIKELVISGESRHALHFFDGDAMDALDLVTALRDELGLTEDEQA